MNITQTISEVIQLSKSRIARDSAIVFAGNILSAVLGFVATVLITRTLGPAQFGLFSVALAVMMIASQLSDFGINTGLVRFASLYLKTDKLKAHLMFKVSLKVKLIVSMSIFLIGLLVSPSLAIYVFKKPELIVALRLAFMGAIGLSLMGYISTTLQARQSFAKFASINIINSGGKLALVGILVLVRNLNLFSALTSVITVPFMAFLIGSLIIPRDFLKVKGNEKESFRELFHFSKWILVSVFCVMIITRLDILMLGHFSDSKTVGIYSAAFGLAYFFPIFTGSFVTALLPEISKLSKKEHLKKYALKSLKLVFITAIFSSPLFFLAKPIILVIYGKEYLASVTILKILLVGFIISLLNQLMTLIAYSINKPKIGGCVNIIQLAFIFGGYSVVIPVYGALGVATINLLTRILGAGIIITYISLVVFGGGGSTKR